MDSKMKIWIDVSLYRIHAQGKFGIARVENMLVTLLPKHHSDVGFFWLDDKFRLKFSDKPPIEESSIRELTSKNWLDYTDLKSLKRESRYQRTIIVITTLLSLMPNLASRWLWSLGSYLNKNFGALNLAMKYTQSKSLNPNRLYIWKLLIQKILFKKNQHKLRSDDIFLIASNDWERRIYEKLSDHIDFKPRLAFVIYDLIPYEYQHLASNVNTSSKFTFWIGSVAQKAEVLFYISQHTQKAFTKMLSDREIQSQARSYLISLPPAITNDGQGIEPSFTRLLGQRFVLVPCTLEVRKNHKILIAAASEAIRLGEEFPQLVFVGSIGWGYEEICRDIELNESLRGKILHFNKINDGELQWLYKHCLLVAYPSFTEGLGLPILEAHQFGKQVICSTAPVFTEVANADTIFLSPFDAIAWKNEIQKYFNSPQNRNMVKIADSDGGAETVKKIVRILEGQEH